MGPRGEPFSVSHFIWHEIGIASEDARKALPFAPYLMFIIESVTRYTYTKDTLHEAYKGEKTHHAAVRETIPQPRGAAADILESSRSSS